MGLQLLETHTLGFVPGYTFVYYLVFDSKEIF
jgi:hypothetical protein